METPKSKKNCITHTEDARVFKRNFLIGNFLAIESKSRGNHMRGCHKIIKIIFYIQINNDISTLYNRICIIPLTFVST